MAILGKDKTEAKASVQRAEKPTARRKMNYFQFIRNADWDGKHHQAGAVVPVSKERLEAELALGTHPKNKDVNGKPKPISGLLNHAEMIEEA